MKLFFAPGKKMNRGQKNEAGPKKWVAHLGPRPAQARPGPGQGRPGPGLGLAWAGSQFDLKNEQFYL